MTRRALASLGRREVRLLALASGQLVSWGILYYGFGALLLPMERALGASRPALSGAFSLGLVLTATAGLVVGPWLDRHGARRLMTGGSIAATLLLLAWSRVTSLPGLYAVWTLLGLALATVLYEPAFAVVTWWYQGRRDQALTVVTLFGGLASTVFVPVASALGERFGFRGAVVVLALVLGAVTIPIHAAVLDPGPPRTAPSAPPRPGATPPVPEGTSPFRLPVFWALTTGFALGAFAFGAIATHLLTHLVERGATTGLAAGVIAAMGAAQLPGRLAFDPLGRRAGLGVRCAVPLLLQAVGVLGFLLTPRPALLFAALLFGAGNGMATLARATSVRELFGTASYGRVAGAIAFLPGIARALGPAAAALLAHATGRFESVLIGLGAVLLVSAAALAAAVDTGGRTRPVPGA